MQVCRGILNLSERGAISPEWDEIVGERGAELSGAVCCEFERWSGGSEHPCERVRKFSPLNSAHMLWPILSIGSFILKAEVQSY